MNDNKLSIVTYQRYNTIKGLSLIILLYILNAIIGNISTHAEEGLLHIHCHIHILRMCIGDL